MVESESELFDLDAFIHRSPFPQLREAVAEETDRIMGGEFDTSTAQARVGLAIYNTVLEQISGLITLLVNAEFSSVPVVLRCLFEAHVAHLNLCREPAYLERLKANDAQQRAKLAKWFAEQEGDSGSYESQIYPEGAAKALSDMKAQLDELAEAGHRPVSVFEAFAIAGMEVQYRTQYWLLCQDGHNNASALTRRHLQQEADGRLQLWFRREPSPADLRFYLRALSSVFFDSAFSHRKMLLDFQVGEIGGLEMLTAQRSEIEGHLE